LEALRATVPVEDEDDNFDYIVGSYETSRENETNRNIFQQDVIGISMLHIKNVLFII